MTCSTLFKSHSPFVFCQLVFQSSATLSNKTKKKSICRQRISVDREYLQSHLLRFFRERPTFPVGCFVEELPKDCLWNREDAAPMKDRKLWGATWYIIQVCIIVRTVLYICIIQVSIIVRSALYIYSNLIHHTRMHYSEISAVISDWKIYQHQHQKHQL